MQDCGARPRAIGFQVLPLELLVAVASHLEADGLLALALVCTDARLAGQDQHVWRALLLRHQRVVLAALFHRQMPEPRDGNTWQQHFFDFDRSWKQIAQERTGRLLLRISTSATQPRQWWAELHTLNPLRPRDSRRRAGEPCAGGQGARTLRTDGGTYGVFDVTEYRKLHPGIERMLVEACDEYDATDSFEEIGHTNDARRVLRSLVVPGLEAVPYDADLHVLRHRASRRQLRQRLCAHAREALRLGSWLFGAWFAALGLLGICAGLCEALTGASVCMRRGL